MSSISRVKYNNLLTDQLTKSDFFIAPGSSKYAYAYKGGLCQHSLDVYTIMLDLCGKFLNEDKLNQYIEKDSIKIVSLFHDFSKMNKLINNAEKKIVHFFKNNSTSVIKRNILLNLLRV